MHFTVAALTCASYVLERSQKAKMNPEPVNSLRFVKVVENFRERSVTGTHILMLS